MSAPPLSRLVQVATILPEGQTIEVVADAVELAALGAANDVESVDRFVARIDLRPAGRDGVAMRGRLEALATRICGVTLDPFVEAVDEPVDVRFAPQDEAIRADQEAAADDDPPEPIVNGAIDVGAALAEFFTLGLDPHPRKPGAVFEEGGADTDEESSPFAALSGLKPRGGGTH